MNRGNRNNSRGFFRGRGRGHSRGNDRGRGFGGFRGNRGGQPFRHNFEKKWTPRPKRELPTKRLSEQDIGVTEYVNNHEGFNGIIKSRYSDFQVSEINLKGEVAKLTSLNTPKSPTENNKVKEDEELVDKYNLEILPMDTWDKVNKIATTIGCEETVEIDVSGMSKEERTQIHEAVKKAFGECVVGRTVTVDDRKLVTFSKYKKGERIDKRVKWLWPGEYVHFIVYKENCDTMEAASRIAERLRCNLKPSMISYAGTKDRRAKTSQWFSLRKFDPKKISACNDLRDIRLGNYSFADHPLKLGMLKGNVFRICLRNVTASDESIDLACTLLKRDGFINYYGLQRFGTRIEVPTYEIGKKLLQANFREAIDAILCEDKEGGGGGGGGGHYRSHTPEARLQHALQQRPNDLSHALDRVPRNSRLLYLHSYQSLIWNKVASERLKRFPREPVVGDLVALADDVEDEELEQESEEENQEENGEKVESIDKNKTKVTEKKKLIPVKVVTEVDVENNSYTIFDIVLPLPGHSVQYPPNLQEVYEELLSKDGLKLDMKHKYRLYTMCGGYRRLVTQPTLEWRCVRYSDPYADLILSDLDELNGQTTTGIEPDGKYKALILTMTLGTSCYATMALRELLKVDTSSDHQAQQNNYHKLAADDEGVADKRKIPTDADDGDTESKKVKLDE